MTRINVVPVEELCDKHLLAEYRELPRVFKLARPCDDAPKTYTLGSGHVKFFYDKLGYCAERFTALKQEMKKRGFNANMTLTGLEGLIDNPLWGHYIPTEEAKALNRARIAERIRAFKRPIR